MRQSIELKGWLASNKGYYDITLSSILQARLQCIILTVYVCLNTVLSKLAGQAVNISAFRDTVSLTLNLSL